MATRGVEPITLPWKRPEKGVSAAELGASFRVEQREDGWHCTVRVGRRAEVLATGLRRLRDAQCRAEAHAATLPEVAAALAKMKAEAAKPAAKREDRPGPSPRTVVPTFESISDGCICGKIEGGTWIADPAGKVSVPAGTAPEVAQEICRVAAQHYAAQRTKTAPTQEGPRGAAKMASRTAPKRKPAVAREATQPTADAAPASPRRASKGKPPKREPAVAREATQSTADAAPVSPRRAGKGKRGKGRTGAARKRLAAKLAGKPGTRAAAKVASESAGKVAAIQVEVKAAARTAGKATAKATTKATAKPTATAKSAKTTKAVAKATTKSTPKGAASTAAQVTAKIVAPAEKAGGRQRKVGKQAPAVAQVKPQKEEPMGKKSGKAASKGACGCMTWAEVDGKSRGEARHGAFVIEPEGKKHALYFYEPEGQSRHLQSGEAGKLRKVAEEMAARGQPAMRAASTGDDAALLKMFMAGAMEEET